MNCLTRTRLVGQQERERKKEREREYKRRWALSRVTAGTGGAAEGK